MLVAGNLQGALKGFKRELKAKNNKDPLLMLKIGGIYQQMSDNVRARMYYMAVGEHYGEHGFFNKAVAAYKKALEITPNDRSILEKLASYNNKVPKYMVNSQILEQIRLQAEESAIKKGIQEDSSNLDDSQNLDRTFKFPDPEDDPIPLKPETPTEKPPAKIEAQEDIAGTPRADDEDSKALDTDSEEDLDVALFGKQAAIAATPVAPASEEKGWNPLENADPDFDPNASLRLEEDDDAEAEPAVQTPLIDPNLIPKAKPKKTGELSDQEQAMEAIAKRLEQEAAKPKQPTSPSPAVMPANEQSRHAPPGTAPLLGSTTARSVSQDQKMVFSSRSSQSSTSDKDSLSALRTFSSLDDALEDLFSMGPEEDKAARKEQDHRHFPLFRTMSTSVFVDFVMALENREFVAGDVVVRQGNPGREMFIIVDGEVDVILATSQSATTVARLVAGDFFGEAALITGQPRTASVVAKGPTTCLVLSRKHLQDLANNHPSVVETIRSIYYTRMRENESHAN